MFTKCLFKRRIVYQAFLLAVILAIIITGVVQAVLINRKLSGGMILDGDVQYFEISPDGRYTVFMANARFFDRIELFSVRTLGGDRVRLSPDLPSECTIQFFFITPNSQYVVFYGLNYSGVFNTHCGLFSVPIGGGTPIELDGADSGYNITDVLVFNDSHSVLFKLSEAVYEHSKSIIYRVPIGGGARQAISDLVTGYLASQITPDSQYVIYKQVPEMGIPQLIRSDMEGNLITLAQHDILDFKITPDSDYVIFRKGSDSQANLYSVPIGGGTPVILNSSLGPGESVHSFKISPDSAYVVYLADETFDGVNWLYRASVDGGSAVVLLTNTSCTGGNVTSFKIAPNSKAVVYRGDMLKDERFDLFAVSINGPPSYRLNKEMIDDGDVHEFYYEITPNSLGVVFIADARVDGVPEIFSVYINGAGRRRLNNDLPINGGVSNFRISSDSLAVVYRADQVVNDIFNLYAVPSIGGVPFLINAPLIPGGDVDFLFLITPDCKGVVYIADQEYNDTMELFITYDYPELGHMIYLPLVKK